MGRWAGLVSPALPDAGRADTVHPAVVSPQACGRVALYFRPDEAVSALYLGVPETYVRLLQRMAADFNFS